MPRTSRTRSALVLSLCTLAAFGGGAVVGRVSHAAAREDSPYALVDQLGRALVMVEQTYVEPVDRARLVEGALRGMVEKLDPHSSWMSAEEMRVFRSDTEGRFGGVGLEVDVRDDAVIVIAPIEGAPAERAGVRSGDRIVAIDGKPTRGQPIDALVRRMRGQPGTRVTVTLRRENVAEPFDVTLVREQVRVTSVVGRRLEGNVLYVRIKQFQEGTHAELLRTLASLRPRGSRDAGLVLDLRSNPGGLVDEAAAVADELLDGGTIYSTRAREKTVDEVGATRGGALAKLPAVVLVDAFSASAAELVAGALQDQGRAKIVGARTFGKGSVQTIYDLPDGAGLRLTTMRYYTPSGRSIQAQGIAPDVPVAAPPGANAIPVIRERDLDGHLAAEGSAADAGARIVEKAAPLRGRDVPARPSDAEDPVLAAGFRLVLGQAPR